MFGRIPIRLSRLAACAVAAALIGFLSCASTRAQGPLIFFEGGAFPEDIDWLVRWRVLPAVIEGDRRIESGWFIQTLGQGDQNFYRVELDGLVGVNGFFVEWRAVTDNPAWLVDAGQVPTVVSAAGKAGVLYHTRMTDTVAALFRDHAFPLAMASVSAEVPHIYRVEVFADNYIWYIDGVVVDSGKPEGPYPDENAFLIWGAEVTFEEAPPATTAWDYVRAGEVPIHGSGDYDVSGYQDMFDYYFVHDCLIKDGPGIVSGPGNNAGPGCRFADLNFDADVDLRDFADFQNLFFEVPCKPDCDEPCWICWGGPGDTARGPDTDSD